MADEQPPEPWPYVAADAHGWPDAGDCANASDASSEICKAKLEVRKKRTDQEIARSKAQLDAEITTAKAQADADIAVAQTYYDSVFEIAKGSIDRTRASAETVQKGAGAIVTLYAGILAL